MIRSSTAIWKGPGKTGVGELTTTSHKILHSPFNFQSRFSNDVDNTNPEELIAAAHAMDFVMKLSFVLGEAGFIPESIVTTANINFANGSIISSRLILHAKIPGITEAIFLASVREAQQTCPVSRALQVDITAEASLDSL